MHIFSTRPLLLELQTLTCRTCRTDVHNVAVGHKDAVKLLFGIGVASEIDSSVGEKKEENQCNTENIKLNNSLPSSLKTRTLWRGLYMNISICMDTEVLFSFFPYNTVPQFDLTPPGQEYFAVGGSRSEVRGKAEPWIQDSELCCKSWTESGLPAPVWRDIPPPRPEREFTSPQVQFQAENTCQYADCSWVLSFISYTEKSSALPRMGQSQGQSTEVLQEFQMQGNFAAAQRGAQIPSVRLFPLSCSFSFEKDLDKQGPERNCPALAAPTHCCVFKGSRTPE